MGAQENVAPSPALAPKRRYLFTKEQALQHRQLQLLGWTDQPKALSTGWEEGEEFHQEICLEQAEEHHTTNVRRAAPEVS